MADKDKRASDLAEAVHEAQHVVARAHAQPAGPDRVRIIQLAEKAHMVAHQRHEHHISGQASAPIKVER